MVEHETENLFVGGSNPPLLIIQGYSSIGRAPCFGLGCSGSNPDIPATINRDIAQLVEHHALDLVVQVRVLISLLCYSGF